MKLYYSPGACSLASHIALREIGADFSLEKVDTAKQKTESGADFGAINPKGYVPALRIEGDAVITEGAAILQYVADLKPATGLLPAAGTMERVRVQEHLNFVASELHKAFAPLFAATPPVAEARDAVLAVLGRKLAIVEAALADGRAYLMGAGFTVADAYLCVVANWSNFVGVDLSPWPKLKAFVARVGGREKTIEALRAEGLMPA